MNKNIIKIFFIGCLPTFLLFLFIPIILIFSLISINSNYCIKDVINAGGNIFNEDYVVLQEFGFTAWATGAGSGLYAGTGVGHTGIDLQPVNFRDFNAEDVGVYTISDGIVENIGYTEIGGNYVYVRMSTDKVAYYGHLKNTTVSKGQKLQKGEKLGNLGNSGLTNIYHVHFEVQENYPNLATKDSSIYLGSQKLKTGDVIRIKDKIQSNIDIKSGKG